MAFLQNRRQRDDIGYDSDSLVLRSVQLLLLTFLLLLLLVEVGARLGSHFVVFCFESGFAGNLVFLRVIGFEVLGFHLLLKVLDFSQLFLLVPQSFEQQFFKWTLGVGDIDLSFREGILLVLLAGIFCSVFLGLVCIALIHILINLSQNFKNC